MVTSWISVSIPNCLLDSAHKAGMFQYLTTTNKRPFEEYSIITMPLLFVEWMTTFSWDPVDILFHTLETPSFEMSQVDGLLLNITFAFDFFKHPYEETKKVRKFDSLRRTSTEVAREVIGWILDVGMTIPLYHNVTVADSSYIQVFDDYLRVDVDFIHKNKCS
uniref:Cyclin N-terminal domain-containing protein n=1 Tax=Caenorhabditis tropicalis TaxID=1561998 RepID=A0A1I7UV86_9PELO